MNQLIQKYIFTYHYFCDDDYKKTYVLIIKIYYQIYKIHKFINKNTIFKIN